MICKVCKNEYMTKRRYGNILQHYCGLCYHSEVEKIYPGQDFTRIEIFVGDSE